MPYIRLEDRPKFTYLITEVLGILGDPTDSLYVKGEHFGYFVNRVCKRWLSDPEAGHESFNSTFFNVSKKKTLANCADNVAAAINRGDPIATAGELNYVLSAVLWGALGQADGFANANYGMRTYLRAMLERVQSTITTVNSGSQRDRTMTFRRHLIVWGVLGDVISECYRRVTAAYEDVKLSGSSDGVAGGYRANDLWKDGKLVLPETGTALAAKE